MPIFSPSPHFFPLTPLSLTNLSSTSCLCTLNFPPLPSLLPHPPHFSPTPLTSPHSLTSPTLPSLLPHSPHFSPTPLTSHLLPSLLTHSPHFLPTPLTSHPHPSPTPLISHLLPSLLTHSPHFLPTPLTSHPLPSFLTYSPHFSPTPLTSCPLPSLLAHSPYFSPSLLPHSSHFSTQTSLSHHCPKNVAGVVMTGAGMAGLTYFANNEDDPYITLKDPVSWYHNISRHYPMPYWRFIECHKHSMDQSPINQNFDLNNLDKIPSQHERASQN